jgi:5'-deoxynucleotidase YfbR-like HD superfamily hydrolase
MQHVETVRGDAPERLKALFGEIGDLKRLRSAGRQGTIATRLFRAAWSELAAGAPVPEVARRITAQALAAARLGDLDRPLLIEAGLPPAEVNRVLCRAVEEVSLPVPEPLRSALVAAIAVPGPGGSGELPRFVGALEDQPRAGVTCPGRPRIVLEPAENHAEHCLVVAVYGVILAPRYGADPAAVFLAALAHHLHNAGMPDAGFTGEMLLGDHLGAVMDHFIADALASLEPGLRRRVVEARECLADAETPEGRAFHAADVIDRVMEIGQHLRAASLTMEVVLGEMALVHDGPVKPFHDRVLAEMCIP